MSAQPAFEQSVRTRLASFRGNVSLYAKNIDTGQSFEIKSDHRVRTASTIKLPIAIAAFAAVQQGKASWNETIVLRDADKVGGSGVLSELRDGTSLTLRDLVHLMIVVSDNTATNLVLDRVPADFVNAQMERMGLRQTRVLRKVLGKRGAEGHSREGRLEEFKRFGLGVSTPREMVTLIEKLERGEVVSPEASRQVLDILQRQQDKSGIGRRRAAETASKSGTLDALRSDVALVRSTGGRIGIAITVDDLPDVDYSADNPGGRLIADIADVLVSGLAVRVADLGKPERIVPLQAELDHVQGIHVDGDRLWLSSVHRNKRTGHLAEFEIASGKLVRTIEVHKGERYHPGGIAGDGSSIWVPLAEYKRDSSAVIQRRNRDTLQLEAEFEVEDHIGCIAVEGDRLFGGNWDSRQIYEWTRHGKLVAVHTNRSGTSYQDIKAFGGNLVASGLRSGGAGAVDWLDAKTLALQRRLLAGRTDRGVTLTHEGMAIANGRLYLLPEDGPSRLFVYRLPW